VPNSLPTWRHVVKRHLKANWPEGARVLDVGAGSGEWGRHLRDAFDVDAVEVWPAYVEQYGLREVYGNVWVGDIEKLEHLLPRYDVVLLGDVIEHLEARAAQHLVERLAARHGEVVAVVPWKWEQGPSGGNPHEEHLQTDLTPELFAERYPLLRIQGADEETGWATTKPQAVRIFLATPVYKAAHPNHVRSVNHAIATLPYYFAGRRHVGDSYVARARAELLSWYLLGDYTHFLQVDDDVSFHPELLQRMVELDRPALLALCAYRSDKPGEKGNPVFRALPGAVAEADGTALARYLGAGFCLVQDAALRRTLAHFPGLRCSTNPDSRRMSRKTWWLWGGYVADEPALPEGREGLSEDYAFSARMAAAGVEQRVDLKSAVAHWDGERAYIPDGFQMADNRAAA
jgi:SAM-dependent methyltransferase